jgi:hypothetical protein
LNQTTHAIAYSISAVSATPYFTASVATQSAVLCRKDPAAAAAAAAGAMLAAAGTAFGSSLFQLLGADFLAGFMATTGVQHALLHALYVNACSCNPC